MYKVFVIVLLADMIYSVRNIWLLYAPATKTALVDSVSSFI